MKFFIFISIIIFLVNSGDTYSQNIKNARFKHITTQDGLSQKTVQTIYQDHIGFMWFGTQDGLNRYDGKEIRVYRHHQNDGRLISHDVIRAITEDSNNKLWVATNGGINEYIPQLDSFNKVEVLSGKDEVERFNTLYSDSKGNLWAGSDGNGLFKLKVNSKESFHKVNLSDQLDDAEIRALYEDSRGRLWVGTNKKGLFLYSNNKVTQFKNDEMEGSISHNSIRTIIEDRKGRLWIGTRGGGLNRYEELKKSFYSYEASPSNENSLGHDRVYKVIEDFNGNIWVATDGGISVYQEKQDNFIAITQKSSQVNGLSHNRVLSAFQDTGGLIWFGTLSGLNIWNPRAAKFNHHRNVPEDESSLSNNTIYSFEELHDGTIAIGTFGGGVNLLDVESSVITQASFGNEPSSKRVMAILEDRDKNLWLGSISHGVELILSTGEVQTFNSESGNKRSLSANGVTDILQDRDGEIWISTYRSGLNRYNPKISGFSQYNLNNNGSGLVSENVFGLTEDDEGYLWLATDGGGVSRLDKKNGEIKTILHQDSDNQSLSGNIASSIYHDSKGRIWIGTFGNGLNLWTAQNRRNLNNEFVHYDISSGLNSNTINGVVEDNDGNIWISTVKGVSKLNPESDLIVNFNLADEIHGNEFNQGAILKSRDGKLYFGGLNGVSSFSPSEVQKNNHIPKVVLTNILNGNQPIKFESIPSSIKKIEFGHKDYLITFLFSALDYSSPEKNMYKYMLEGFDTDWINAKNLGRATYTNLPSGKYTLKVKGSNNDGAWSDEEVNLEVIINPAPWATWWAYSIYATLFCLMLIYLIRYQAKRLADHELFQDQVHERVAQKTELYIKNNETLNDKLQQLKSSSLFDEQSEIYSQAAFMEFFIVALKMIKAFNAQESIETKALVGILNFKGDDLSTRVLTDLSESLNKEALFIARWNDSQLAILTLVNSDSLAKEKAGRLLTLCSEATKKEGLSCEVSMGYTLPLYSSENHNMEIETILMLTEHAAYSASKLGRDRFVGIADIYQLVSSAVLKQTVGAENIVELEGLYKIESNA